LIFNNNFYDYYDIEKAGKNASLLIFAFSGLCW